MILHSMLSSTCFAGRSCADHDAGIVKATPHVRNSTRRVAAAAATVKKHATAKKPARITI